MVVPVWTHFGKIQGVLTSLLVEKGIFTREEFLEMVKVVNKEMKKKEGGER
jgi:hypothetical protein